MFLGESCFSSRFRQVRLRARCPGPRDAIHRRRGEGDSATRRARHGFFHQKERKQQLDDGWPESIVHHVVSQSVSYLASVLCEVLSRVS